LHTLLDRQWTEPLPIHAWVIDHPEGLIVVDTGDTARTSERGYFPRWHPYFRWGLRAFIEPEDEIGPQMRQLGFSPEEVRWVVLTHLHADHAGGLHHFPSSEILVSREEYEGAVGSGGRLRGYLNQHWPTWFSPRLIDLEEKRLGAFPASFAVTDAGDVLVVPTNGHTPGHVSVVVRQKDHLVFLAGDASYSQDLMLAEIADGVGPDERAARESLRRIKRLAREQPMVFLPAHDPDTLSRFETNKLVED
jgi:glyoxylase-like metal-dependent hydrolase (beta-lactamase superfamily II)